MSAQGRYIEELEDQKRRLLLKMSAVQALLAVCIQRAGEPVVIQKSELDAPLTVAIKWLPDGMELTTVAGENKIEQTQIEVPRIVVPQ